jgi:hypothetical protein
MSVILSEKSEQSSKEREEDSRMIVFPDDRIAKRENPNKLPVMEKIS